MADSRVDALIAHSKETARLADAYRTSPTPENGVLHAVHVWRNGCGNGGPGECEDCNELFLKVIRKRLSGDTTDG